MLRTLLGVLAGALAMLVAIIAIEFAGQLLFPPPPGLDPRDPAQLEQVMALLPFGAKALVVLAWAVGAFVGGWIAARIARAHPRIAAGVVGALVVIGVAMMVLEMPAHPLWMSACGLLLPLPLALLAARLARRA